MKAEKIRMAEIDKTFYHGSDLYSDGDEAENTILQIIRDSKGFYDLDQMTWPTFYHLNPIRENICNWYPFVKGSRVLEIGAGCGGVTGALCGKGLDVYSVDLSLRRSTINYERHRDAENLHLMVGNLNEISFPEPFDYILLIGVLEYAGRFTEGEHPYRRFLENIRRLLKPDGKLLIAIENRLGLKYFAGAGEDHLGVPFIGLKGYPVDRGVRTFSRSEIEHLLKKSGYQGCRFYYPYPDYKLPKEIFTDQILSDQNHFSGHYGRPYQVFDMDRTDIFPETEMAETLRKDGVAGAFANSFLVETTIDSNALSSRRVYYAKMNKDRRKVFQTGTIIYGEGKPEQVLKYALTEEAQEQIARIAENEHRLAAERNVLQGTLYGKEILYPYIPAGTLEDILREAELDQERETVIRIFRQIRELAEVKPVRKRYDSKSFTEWFGEARILEQEPICTEMANPELTPDNILTDQGKMIISDCEWVTDFAVPVSFLTWRSAEKTYERHPRLQRILAKEALWRVLEIPEEIIPVYQEWSQHFDYQYILEKSVSSFARTHEITDLHPAAVKAKDNEIQEQKAQIERLALCEQELKEETARQQEQIENLILDKQKLEKNLAQQEDSAQQLKKDIEDILSSRSWRMTAVFRAVREKVLGTEKKVKQIRN